MNDEALHSIKLNHVEVSGWWTSPSFVNNTPGNSFHLFVGNGWIVKHKKHPVKVGQCPSGHIYIYIYLYLLNCWAGLFVLCPTCSDFKIEMVVVINDMVTCPHALKKTIRCLFHLDWGPGGYLHALLIGKKKHVKTQQPSPNRQTDKPTTEVRSVPYHLWERVRTWWSNWNLRFCPTRG